MLSARTALGGMMSKLSIGSIVKSKRFQRLVGSEAVQAVDAFVNNHVMVRLRQRERRNQTPPAPTAEWLRTRFCAEPFRTLETTHTGLAFVCCPVWLPTPIGTMSSDPAEVWNGKVAREVRQSIVDGTFAHCNHLHCPAITNRTLPSREAPESRRLIAEHEAAVEGGGTTSWPAKVNLSHDKSCNLSCPSCRTDLYLASKSKQASLDATTESFVLPMLEKAETVMVTGSGDPFGSNHFRRLIKKITPEAYPNLRFDLITNGQLMNRRAWDELALGGRVGNVHISVDATTARTYAIVRRGGTFARLLDNLAFIADLRRTGGIESLDFSMVVQAENFREMPDFVALGRDYAADSVHFQMIRQRDIFGADDYREAFVGDPAHPDHREFLDVIAGHAGWCDGTPRIEIGNVLAYVGASCVGASGMPEAATAH